MRQFVSGTDSNSGLPKKPGRTNRRETGDGLLLVRRQGVAGPQKIANLRQRTSSKAKSRRRSVVKRRPATE